MEKQIDVITINADGTVSLPATTMTTQQLDELLAKLAHLRAHMAPPVAEEPTPGQRLSFSENAVCMIPKTSANGIDLLFRHPGFGWLAFGLGTANAASIGAKLVALAANAGPHLDVSAEVDAPLH